MPRRGPPLDLETVGAASMPTQSLLLSCPHCGAQFAPRPGKIHCSDRCQRRQTEKRRRLRLRAGAPPRPTISARFWAKVDKQGPDDCWPWLAYRNEKGYGCFFDGTRDIRAHRYALREAGIAVPDGMEPDHTCGHSWCVNVRHLEMVTSLENIRRGRRRRGIAPATELTREQVLAIRSDQRGSTVLSRAYGIDKRTVLHIKRRTRYAYF